MKKIILISPHFPPSNLAAVHRSRLFAQHLPEHGWEPIVLTVHEKYYEETLDYNLAELLPSKLRIEKVNAFALTKPRLVGDIGLRAFFQLYRRAKQLISIEKIDFLYILIPSFYCALLGRLLHYSTGIKYGIDYIDPWVHNFPGSNKLFSRHWFSTHIAKVLEPVAVKKASLITGVAEGYYAGVIKRNPHLLTHTIFCAMPYGGEEKDHEKMRTLNVQPYLFKRKRDKIQLVYAGAMLPNALMPLEAIFKSLNQNIECFANVEFYFVGTGKNSNSPDSYSIRPLALKYDLWQKNIFEYPQRIPYLDVLVHLNIADGIFILGSTEAHYTPSKVYQGVLSGKPIFAVLHKQSTAVKVLHDSGTGIVLDFDEQDGFSSIETKFAPTMRRYLEWSKTYNSAEMNYNAFAEYSANKITTLLAVHLDKIAR